MAKLKVNPAASYRRYLSYFEPIWMLLAYQQAKMAEHLEGDALSHHNVLCLYHQARIKEEINEIIRKVRLTFFNEAQKFYYLRYYRADWLVRNSSLMPGQDKATWRISSEILSANAKMMTRFNIIVDELRAFDSVKDFAYMEEYGLSFMQRVNNLNDVIEGDILHFFGQAQGFYRDYKAGQVVRPANLWFLKHLSEVKPTKNQPYSVNSDLAFPTEDPAVYVPGIEDKSLKAEFMRIEAKWNELRSAGKNVVDMREHHHKVFLNIDDDWAWYAVDAGYCERTGDIMGHCGNRPSVSHGDVLLNLGKKYGEGYVPHLTFILNSGVLGEMKGKANQKPKEIYHPQIMALLMDERILFILGGGHAAENNFAVTDLNVDYKRLITKKRPDILSYESFIEKNENNPDILPMLRSNYDINDIFRSFNLKLKKEGSTYYLESDLFRLKDMINKLGRRSMIFDSISILNAFSYVGELNNVYHQLSDKEAFELAAKVIAKLLKAPARRMKKGKPFYGVATRSRKQKLFKSKLRPHLRVVDGEVEVSKEALELARSAYFDILSQDVSNDAESSIQHELSQETWLGFTISSGNKGIYSLEDTCRLVGDLKSFISQAAEIAFRGKEMTDLPKPPDGLMGQYLYEKMRNGLGGDMDHDSSEFEDAFEQRIDELTSSEPTY